MAFSPTFLLRIVILEPRGFQHWTFQTRNRFFSLPHYPPPTTSFCINIMIFIISAWLFMVLIIYTQYHVLNIHASITQTMFMEVQPQQKKRCYCDCGFETTAYSDHHTAEHKKSKQHEPWQQTCKMQRLDNKFPKAAAVQIIIQKINNLYLINT